jgi:hypothetical protein
MSIVMALLADAWWFAELDMLGFAEFVLSRSSLLTCIRLDFLQTSFLTTGRCFRRRCGLLYSLVAAWDGPIEARWMWYNGFCIFCWWVLLKLDVNYAWTFWNQSMLWIGPQHVGSAEMLNWDLLKLDGWKKMDSIDNGFCFCWCCSIEARCQ